MKKVFAILLILSVLLSVLSGCEITDPKQTDSETQESYPHEDMILALPDDIIARTDITDIPALYLKYFFVDSISEFCRIYYQNMGEYFNVNIPLHDQKPTAEGFTEYNTWFDYFLKMSKSALEYHVVLYEQAVKNGISLDEKELESIEELLSEYEKEAAEYESTFEEFIQEVYYGIGDGVTKENMRKLLVFVRTAEKFAETTYGDYEFTDQEIEAVFEKNKYDYLVADYNLCNIFPDTDQTDSDEKIEEAKKKALALGNDYAKLLNEGMDFMAAYKKIFPNKKDSDYLAFQKNYSYERASYSYDLGESTLITDEAEWVFTGSKTAGEVTVLQDNSGRVKVVQVVRPPYRDDMLLPNLRIIYLSLQDGTYTEKTGEAKSEELKKQIDSSANKQELVISLVDQYSTDSTTAQNDGLLENVYPSHPALTTDISNWCFDANTKVGDVMTAKYTYNGIVTGYFVVYLDSFGDTMWRYNIIKSMRNSKMSEFVEQWLDELVINYDDNKTDTIYK